MNRRPVSPSRQGASTSQQGTSLNQQGEAHDSLAALERAKRQSVGQLLFKCARLFNERALQRVNERGIYPVLRPAHTNLVPHIGFEGTRLVELARKLGISKQAVGQTVAELEQLGVVETLADPSDARAKLVRFTAEGKSAIAHGLEVLVEIENELRPEVGAEHMTALHEALLVLESVLAGDGLTSSQPTADGNEQLGSVATPNARKLPTRARKR